MGVDLLQQGIPVPDRARHGPPVDVVEPLVVRPRRLDVVDEEAAVGRVRAGLDRGQVDPDDLAVRMLVGEVDGPRPGARAEVEHMPRLAGQRRAVQPAAEDHPEDVVRQVEPFLLLLIVGHHVRAFAEGVVPAAIFEFVVLTGRNA